MQRSRFIFVGIVILGLIVRYFLYVSWNGDLYLHNLVEEKIIIEGIIIEEPVPKESYTRLTVRVLHAEGTKIKNTNILVYDKAYSERKYGDKILAQGKLTRPKNFEGDSGREFNYIAYLAKDRIFFEMKYAEVELVKQGRGNILKSCALKIKNKSVDVLQKLLPFPESGLASGLVVAGKQALPKNIQDEFQKTGTIQVVVLSGYNVMLVAEAIILLFSKLPRNFGIAASAVTIVLFSIAAGASATIIRAVIMVLIGLSSQLMHRKYNVGRALVIAGVLMLYANPMLLFFDPSFQLSFLATTGLIYMTPIVAKKCTFVTERFKLREIISSTIATQVFVTPFLIYLTGELSLVTVPANIVLSIFIPAAMLASFTTAIVGIFVPLLAVPMSFAAFLFLKIILTAVHVFSLIPYASLSFTSISLWSVFVVYVCFAVMLIRFHTIKLAHHCKKRPAKAC